MGAFAEGQRLGLAAFQGGANAASDMVRTKQTREMFDQREANDLARDEVRNRIAEERYKPIKQKMELENSVAQEIQKRTIANYLEADSAFKQYQAGKAALDPGSPTYSRDYGDLVGRFASTMAKHEGVRKQFDADFTVTTQGERYTIAHQGALNLLALQKRAVDVGQAAAAMTVQEAVQRGEMKVVDGIEYIEARIKQAEEEQGQKDLAAKIQVASAAAAARRDPNTVTEITPPKDKATGSEIREKMTPEERQRRLKAETEAKAKTTEDTTVQTLVEDYAKHKGSGEKYHGFLNTSSRGSAMALIEAKLRKLGFDTEGNKLNGSASKPASSELPGFKSGNRIK